MNSPTDDLLDPSRRPSTGTSRDGAGRPPADDDNPLESIGKAITDPIATAADDEEPGPDGVPPVTPGG